ncbi:MAG TPA: VOC family protein [Dehalococcoidia bacterium]|nr:VOC family protein [Dehalococcoidia bacterium]
MAMYLDHTIVPAHDKEASARFIARLFGLEYEGLWAHFAPVKVNDTLTLDFDNARDFEGHHYAFLVDDQQFDAVLGRVQESGIAYGSGPGSQDDMRINHHHNGRGFYFRDANGHSWELITHTYIRPE